MSERVEAVVNVIGERDALADISAYGRETAKQALTAADAVMFSEGRVQEAMRVHDLTPRQIYGVIAILKGAEDE